MYRMNRESALSELVQSIRAAEEARTAAFNPQAPEGQQWDDSKYQQALATVAAQIEKYSSNEEIDSLANPELAALAHLYVMAATVEQSRARHTLAAQQDKQAALARAENWIDRLDPLASKLAQADFHRTADGSPFLWPVELERVRGRLAERRGDLAGNTEEKKRYHQEAAVHFNKAVELATKVSRETNQEDVRAAASMAAGTARVEAVLANPGNEQQIIQEFKQALAELQQSWQANYHNTDRLGASLARMLQFIQEHQEMAALANLAPQIRHTLRKDLQPLVASGDQQAKKFLETLDKSVSGRL